MRKSLPLSHETQWRLGEVKRPPEESSVGRDRGPPSAEATTPQCSLAPAGRSHTYFKMRKMGLGSTLDLQEGIPKGRPKKTSIKPQLGSQRLRLQPRQHTRALSPLTGFPTETPCLAGASQQSPIPELGLPRCVPTTVKDKAGDVNEAFETVITLTGEMLAQGHL